MNNFGGKLDVVGQIAGTNGPFTVKVDGENAVIFNNTNFWGAGRIKTGTNTISIVTSDASTNRNEKLRHVTFPPTNPQQFTWDANGNLANDDQRNYTWNEENKLVAIESGSGIPAASRKRSEFAYDAQSRMFERKDYSGYTNSAYSVTNIIRYVWDGYNIISEISRSDTPSLAYTNTYTWGLDLSRSLQGASGVGGLLSASFGGTGSVTSVFFTFDANGNVSELLQSTAYGPQSVLAHYEYDPFGRVVAKSGPLADVNLWQFSTKQFDPIWGLNWYPYRPYSPSLHIWLARDPIWERGGILLYGFVGNEPVNYYDILGFYGCSGPCEIAITLQNSKDDADREIFGSLAKAYREQQGCGKECDQSKKAQCQAVAWAAHAARVGEIWQRYNYALTIVDLQDLMASNPECFEAFPFPEGGVYYRPKGMPPPPQTPRAPNPLLP